MQVAEQSLTLMADHQEAIRDVVRKRYVAERLEIIVLTRVGDSVVLISPQPAS